MAKVPLNFFKRISQPNLTNVDTQIYQVPFETAGIIISALATNTNSQAATITVSLSTPAVPNARVNQQSIYPILNNFTIPPNDTVNVVVNKLVLSQFDCFIVKGDSSVNVTLSILETVNKNY